MISIEITTPDGVQLYPLPGDHATIGRLTSNDIALPYSHISRRHAEVRFASGAWWVADLGSTNGLHINGERVHEARLEPGEVIALSPHVTLRLIATDAISTPIPPLAQSDPPPAPPIESSPSVTPLSELAPRSPYAEDETPFYPHMRPAPPRRSEPRITPIQTPRPAVDESRQATPAAQSTEAAELQARAERIARRRAATGAPSSRLHICQTCGQMTAPDAVYCQSCHHSIATECPRCRFSLLPIQDLCPRCQTPNPGSVRRGSHATDH